MSYTKLTSNKRQQLKKMMDDFSTFSWGPIKVKDNLDAFDAFGVFIVGGKDALKFSNGPGFSNKYASSQFQSKNTILSGVEFKTQTISFTMGVYWFTIEEYRELLMWLHPYEVNDLGFSFAPEWRYTAKLAKFDDSTRYILGRDENGNNRYYTEIKLSFDIQGEPCLRHTTNYQFNVNTDVNTMVYTFNNSDFIESDLDIPVELEVTLVPEIVDATANEFSIDFFVKIPTAIDAEDSTNNTYATYPLFSGVFNNLQTNPINSDMAFELHYLSDIGLLLQKNGDSSESLLTLQSTSTAGKRIIDQLSVNRFKLPGVLESNLSKTFFQNIVFVLSSSTNWKITSTTLTITPRTNII